MKTCILRGLYLFFLALLITTVLWGNIPLADVQATADTWTTAQSMTSSRYWHTSTLLQTGQVLVTGGAADSSEYLDSAELYDPISNDLDDYRIFRNRSPVSYRHTASQRKSIDRWGKRKQWLFK